MEKKDIFGFINTKTTSVDSKDYVYKVVFDDDSVCYIDSVFRLKLKNMGMFQPDKYDLIIQEMERLTRKNKLVVFEGEEDIDMITIDEAIYLTIEDVCNPLLIFAEDKSRGSDYGD